MLLLFNASVSDLENETSDSLFLFPYLFYIKIIKAPHLSEDQCKHIYEHFCLCSVHLKAVFVDVDRC